jgi:hypothetical protein
MFYSTIEFYLLTFDLETACCILRVFHHCRSMMSVAIFETVLVLFNEDGILFQSSTTLYLKKCLLTSSIAVWIRKFSGSAALRVFLSALLTERNHVIVTAVLF